MQREPTALPPTTFTICFTGTTHVRLDGIESRLKEALDSVVPELNLTRVGPPTITVQSRDEDFIPLSDYVPPPNTPIQESDQEPALSPTPPSECAQFNPADFPLPSDTDDLEQQFPENQEPEKDAVQVPIARDHFNHTRDELDEMFTSFDSHDPDAQNDKKGNKQCTDLTEKAMRFSVYDKLSALTTDNDKDSLGNLASPEQNHSSIRRSAHSSSDDNEEMTFVYEGSSTVQSEGKPKTSCLKKQKNSWSSDDDSRETRVEKKGNSLDIGDAKETKRQPCLKKSNSRGEDLSDQSRKSSLSSRGESNKAHGSSSTTTSRANYKSSFSDRNNNDRQRSSTGYNPGSHRGSSVFHRNGNRDDRFRRGSRESDRDDFRRRDQDRAGSGREFRPREKRNTSSEREVSVYNDDNRFGEKDYASRRNEDRSFSRFRDGGFQKYDARPSRDEHISNHNRPHFADREHRSYGGQSYRREFRGEHCTRSGRGAFGQTPTDGHRRRRDRDSERNSDER